MSTNFVPLSHSVANHILEMIMEEGRFAFGSKLPNEMDLAEELSVSRGSIREGVRELVARGVLEIRRGKGTFVTEDPLGALDPLGLAGASDPRKLLRDWYEMRIAYSPEVARQAAIHATADEVERIARYELQTKMLIRSGKSFKEADNSFHGAIAAASHNLVFERMTPLLYSSMTIAQDELERLQKRHESSEAADNVIRYHAEILRFIRQRDPDGAYLAMQYHMKTIMCDLKL